jgi:predicted DNA-binding transcriptional regulator YafY
MDILSPPRACDPWAVHSAKTFLEGKDKLSALTPRQLKIVNYIEEKREVTAEKIMEDLILPEKELKREFAILRHMEILRATKKGGKIFYAMFQERP